MPRRYGGAVEAGSNSTGLHCIRKPRLEVIRWLCTPEKHSDVMPAGDCTAGRQRQFTLKLPARRALQSRAGS